MPLRPRRSVLRARPGRLALVTLAIGLAVGSGVPAAAGGPIPRDALPVFAAEPAPGAADVTASRGGLEPARLALDDRRAAAPAMSTTDIRDTDGPSAAIQPLTVEQDELIVRWRDSDGLGPGIAMPYRVQPPAVAKAKPTVPQWSGRYNLFQANAFVTQKTFKWCVAASVQMMVNLVRERTDRSGKTQARMIAYAQRWDNGPYGEEGGTDVTGWVAALRHYGAGKYRAVGATTAARALRVAATAMAQTGRPAGILVMDGRHAWVLHGFESKTDPRRDRRAQITAVRISGPLYPLQQKNGYDPRPNTRLSVRKLERYFLPTSVGTMIGRYVVVIPTH